MLLKDKKLKNKKLNSKKVKRSKKFKLAPNKFNNAKKKKQKEN